MRKLDPFLIFLMLLSRTISFLLKSTRSLYLHNTRAFLNRILARNEECFQRDGQTFISLSSEDYRTKHITKILKSSVGDFLRCGVLENGMTDAAVITSMCPVNGITINCGSSIQWSLNDRPAVDLVLAVPRPLRLQRIIPIIACLGVDNLILINARKVEGDFFGSHLFRQPLELEQLLIEGLSQSAVDCRLPSITVYKNPRDFIGKELDLMNDRQVTHRIIAHPTKRSVENNGIEEVRLLRSLRSIQGVGKTRVMIAIGPEGGWEDAEVEMYEQRGGFQRISLGERILRTDIAVPVLLGLANEWLADIRANHLIDI